MKRLKTALTCLLLVCCASLLISCSGTVAEAPVYTPGQIAEVQRYEADVLESYDRFQALPEFLAERNWTALRNLIHGPLGDLRRQMANLNSVLIASDQKQAEKLTQSFFQHLESLDGAAKEQEVQRSQTLLNLAQSDLDAFLDLLPEKAGANEA